MQRPITRTSKEIVVASISAVVAIICAVIAAYATIESRKASTTSGSAADEATQASGKVRQALESSTFGFGKTVEIAWTSARGWNKADQAGFVSFYADSGVDLVYFSIEIEEAHVKYGPMFSNNETAVAMTYPVGAGLRWRIQVSSDKGGVTGVNDVNGRARVFWTPLTP